MTIALGIVGLGNILPAYLRTLRRSRQFHIVGGVGGHPARTAARAAALGLKPLSMEELLASEAQVILSSTPPQAHGVVWRRRQHHGAPNQHPHTTNVRGIGLIDMVQAWQAHRPHRCSAELALHVLEVMERALDAAHTGQAQTLTTTCERPEPLPSSWLAASATGRV